jgi:hypothetical protein
MQDSQVTSQSAIAMMVREERKNDAHSYLIYMATYTSQLCLAVFVLAVASMARYQKFSSVLLAFGVALLSDIVLKITLTVRYQKEINPTKKTKLKSWVEIISGVKDLVLLLFLVAWSEVRRSNTSRRCGDKRTSTRRQCWAPA